jgi:hypothetical protein
MEYSLLLNIVNDEIEEKNKEIDEIAIPEVKPQVRVNLPDHLRLK